MSFPFRPQQQTPAYDVPLVHQVLEDFETFNEVIKKAKAKEPLLFELEHDVVPTMENIMNLQKQWLKKSRSRIIITTGIAGGFFTRKPPLKIEGWRKGHAMILFRIILRL